MGRTRDHGGSIIIMIQRVLAFLEDIPHSAFFPCVCVCARRRHLGQTGKGWASEFTNRKGSCSARLTVLFLGSGLDGWGIVLDFDAAVGGVDGVVLGGRSVAVMSRNSTVLVVPTCVCVCVCCVDILLPKYSVHFILNPLILHSLLKQPPEHLPFPLHIPRPSPRRQHPADPPKPRRQPKHPRLRNRPLHQRLHVSAPEPKRPKPPRLVPQLLEERLDRVGEDFACAGLFDVGDVDAEGLGRLQVAEGVAWGCEAEL